MNPLDTNPSPVVAREFVPGELVAGESAARPTPALSTPPLNHVIGTNYSGADWRGRQVSRTLFEDVSFQGADLRGAVFEGVIFRRCNFQGACLDGAQLRSVSGAYILAEGASLRHVRGENTQWIGCFREADFTGSQWSHSNFYSSDLRDAIGVRSFRDGRLRSAPAPSVVAMESAPMSGPATGPATGPVAGLATGGPGTGGPVTDISPARTGGTPPPGFPPFRDRFPDR